MAETGLDFGWRKALEDYVREQARPVDKCGHQPRLYALTRSVGAGLQYDDDVVYAAAWLHDLGVFVGHRPEERSALEQWDSVAYAVARSPEVLRSVGFPVGKIDAVIECIRNHQPQCEPRTTESTVLRDADILEQLGAVGIVRTVAKVGRDTRFQTFTEAAVVLIKALHSLPSQLRLETSRALAEGRVRVMRDFLEGLANESREHLH